ncbi:hypothetical protein BMIN_0884 [Bifidobacterium minimum]|uniref:Uncharacterized protein n=1 Tax=Bifidobacterium minimum TaxID=1693 RepID=A0A087BS91_9BIFI|nr:hypothetical protein BMIN_0884 [Bifidobacterium minimum]
MESAGQTAEDHTTSLPDVMVRTCAEDDMSIRQLRDPVCVAETMKSTDPPTASVWDFAVNERSTSPDAQSAVELDACGDGTSEREIVTSESLTTPINAATPFVRLTTLKTSKARIRINATPTTIRRRR